MNHSRVIWVLVFQFLEANDLIRASGVCFTWCKMIFGLKHPVEEFDLTGTAKLYKFIPLKLLAGLSSLKIDWTDISNEHFCQPMLVGENLEKLDISNCSNLDPRIVLKRRKQLCDLHYLNISGNKKFSLVRFW